VCTLLGACTTADLPADDDSPLRRALEERAHGDVPSDAFDFVAAIPDDELDRMSARACERIGPELSQVELGAASLEMWDQLPEDDVQTIDGADFSILFGVMIGVSCPDRLPEGTDPAALPLDRSAIDAYRQALPTLWAPDHPARRFVASLGDDRLQQLQASACRFSDAGHSPAEVGTAVGAHYGAELSAVERAEIDLGTYPEVYGSLVGWFCPDRLPTIDGQGGAEDRHPPRSEQP
jgi:hypothetical protein